MCPVCEITSLPSGVDSALPDVGFKASEAFHSVSFPPWNLWISHITSYCPCQAAAHLLRHLFVRCCVYGLMIMPRSAHVHYCQKKKKIQFPLLFFFLYSFTLGKLSYEISAMELSCVSARFPGFDQHLAKGCTVWLKADSSYPTVFLKPYPYMVLVKPPSTIQLLI